MKGRRQARWRALLTLGMLAAMSVDTSQAKVGPATLSQLTAWSDLIFVGRVTDLSVDTDGQRFAVVAVEQSWYGSPGAEVRISLLPVWPCDVSRANVGEQAIFFVTKGRDNQWHIAHSGHGRMLIEHEVVSVSTLVVLPGKPYAQTDQMQQVPLQVMTDAVLSRIKKAHPAQSRRALPNNRLKQTARGRSGAESLRRTRAAA